MALGGADPDSVRLQSSDEEVFVVTLREARVSRTLATMLEELGHQHGDVIPLPNVNSHILRKVLAWAKHHVQVEDGKPLTPPASPILTPAPTPPPPSQVPPLQPRPQPRVQQRPNRRVHPPMGAELSQWDRDYLARNRSDVYHLLLAANYLDIKGLMDILCRAVADIIKGKDPDQIRRTFNASDPIDPDALPSPHPLPHPSQSLRPRSGSHSQQHSAVPRPYKETAV